MPSPSTSKTIKSNYILFLSILLTLISCSEERSANITVEDNFIRAADLSLLPLIESEGTTYKHNGIVEDPILTLKNAGCNTIRIRLWHTPANSQSSLAEVKAFSQKIKAAGLKVWLTVHYSDTWADPGNQTKPAAWQNMNFATLKSAVTNYTTLVISEINPDIFQIGNETNDGMLWPEGRLSQNEAQYLELVSAASNTIRTTSPKTKIMLHFAGISSSDWFFNKVANIDYDYIGLSYYPVYHGANLTSLQDKLNSLGQSYNKKVLIAETAYPFTMNYNDQTNNIVGLPTQILSEFEATANGQKKFLLALKNTVKESKDGIGFCYWGAEWIAFRGTTSTNGSPWENQALWDFNNNSLPVMDTFNQN